MTRARASWLVLAACVGALGCSQRRAADDTGREGPGADDPSRAPARLEPRAERVLVEEVRVELLPAEGSPKVELETRRLGRNLGRLLASSPYFTPRPEDIPDGYRARRASIDVRLAYQLEHLDPLAAPGASAGELALILDCRVVWNDAGVESDRAGAEPRGAGVESDRAGVAPWSNLALEQALSAAQAAAPEVFMAELVAELMAAAGHDLIAKEQLRVGGAEAIASGLASDQDEIVSFALELVRESRSSAFFDASVRHLQSQNLHVRDRALDALVAIGDARAVDALARRAEFSDHPFMAAVLGAVTRLGGDDARQYLEFVASGHPDAEVRTLARDGLGALGRAPD